MKYFVCFFLAATLCFSCKNASSSNTDQTTAEPTDNGGSQDDPDLAAIQREQKFELKKEQGKWMITQFICE